MLRPAAQFTPEEAARTSRPRVYRITSAKLKNKKALQFFVVGCQGKAAAQERVAQLMNEIAADPSKRPDFILFLGDNFYDYGVSASDDQDFDSFFYQMYTNPSKVPNIAGIPCFVTLGNHDENIHKKSFLEPEHGIQRGLHQVAHTYNSDRYGATAEKIWLYTSHQHEDETELNLETLQPWNMPSRAYALIFDNDQIFCIDSNTYIRDFFEYFINGDKTDPSNQARWLAEEMQKAQKAGRNVMLAQHHPLITPGKRAYEPDSTLYFNVEDLLKDPDKKLVREMIALAEKLFPRIFTDSGYPYNQLLTEIFKRQRLEFNTVFTAHDHNIYYINNRGDSTAEYKICQITSGGGGGSLQKRNHFKDQNNMGCFLEEHGFVSVSCGKTNKFSIYTLEQRRHLEFNSDHSHALRFYPDKLLPERHKTEKCCAIVKAAIDKYFHFLGSKGEQRHGIFSLKPVNHGAGGVMRANELWAYICHATPDSYVETLNKICQKACEPRYTEPSKHSLITLLNNECSRNYGMDLMSLYRHEMRQYDTSMPRAGILNIGF